MTEILASLTDSCQYGCSYRPRMSAVVVAPLDHSVCGSQMPMVDEISFPVFVGSCFMFVALAVIYVCLYQWRSAHECATFWKYRYVNMHMPVPSACNICLNH